jgi:CO dehydrogenase maturation factor
LAVRIAFVGRAGSGKTTCAAVFCRYLGAQGVPVLAVDAAADRRFGAALGCEGSPPLGPTWPDGRASTSAAGGRGGSRLVDLDPDGELLTRFAVAAPDGVRLLVADTVEPLLDHLVDGEGEYVVLDLAAEACAAGQFTRFDMTVLVTEPTRRDVGVYRQCAAQASAHGVELRVLGNKISDWGHAAWLTEQMGDALVGCFGHSAWVRAAERGVAGSVSGLEPGNAVALAAVREALDACRRALDTQPRKMQAREMQPREMQQGDTAATGSQQCHPAEVAIDVATAYSASSR